MHYNNVTRHSIHCHNCKHFHSNLQWNEEPCGADPYKQFIAHGHVSCDLGGFHNLAFTFGNSSPINVYNNHGTDIHIVQSLFGKDMVSKQCPLKHRAYIIGKDNHNQILLDNLRRILSETGIHIDDIEHILYEFGNTLNTEN